MPGEAKTRVCSQDGSMSVLVSTLKLDEEEYQVRVVDLSLCFAAVLCCAVLCCDSQTQNPPTATPHQ